MARPTQEIIAELLARFEPRVQQAFLEAVDGIRNSIVLRVVVERLERGDITGAIEAMHLDATAFATLEMAIAEAYSGGGNSLVANLPRLIDPSGDRIIFRFGVRNLPAEEVLRDHSATLVTRTVEDQREAIRYSLEEGLSQGRNPRNVGLDVVGRQSRVTNRREGGVIGLTAQQAKAVETARQRLLSGDPAEIRKVLELGRRDKRFDRSILKAIREGKPVPAEFVARWTGRYSDRLLELRGEMLARTETMWALSRSRDDAMAQQIAAGKIEAQDVTKEWVSTHDGRTRFTHRDLDGERVGYDGMFQSASGAVLSHPHDSSAPTAEIVGCRCTVTYRVDRVAALKRAQGF